MKKINTYLILLVTLSSQSFSWAEKYEFVRLACTNFTVTNYNTGDYHGESVELKSGDVAKVIAVPDENSPHYVYLWDGSEYHRFDLTKNGVVAPDLITGPGTLIVASWSKSRTAKVHIAIQRSSDTGSKTLAWNGDSWEGSNDGTQNSNNNSSSPVPDPNGIKYDQLLGWCYFTDTPWLYSYTNGSWYYMHALSEGIFVWNANFPDNGWKKLRG